MRAHERDLCAVKSDRRVVQRCWKHLLCLRARAFPVASRDDAAAVSKLQQGVFYKNSNEETDSRDPLYMPSEMHEQHGYNIVAI